MILCLVGPSCAGKTTSAKYIQSELGMKYFEASEFVRDRYSSMESSKPIIEFVKKEFNNKGKETFAESIVEQILTSDEEQVIVSGFRTEEEIKLLESKFDNVLVAGIYANSLLRYQRKLRRDNPDEDYEYVNFIQKDIIEYNFGIIRILDGKSDVLIINEGTYENLYHSLEELLFPLL